MLEVDPGQSKNRSGWMGLTRYLASVPTVRDGEKTTGHSVIFENAVVREW